MLEVRYQFLNSENTWEPRWASLDCNLLDLPEAIIEFHGQPQPLFHWRVLWRVRPTHAWRSIRIKVPGFDPTNIPDLQ